MNDTLLDPQTVIGAVAAITILGLFAMAFMTGDDDDDNLR